MNLDLICVGKNSPGPVAEALAEMLKRLGHSASVKVVVVADMGRSDRSSGVRKEGERILTSLKEEGRVVLLDERGRSFTSQEFAHQLGTWRDSNVRRVQFIIGGAFGVSEAVRERADLVLAMSRMTFTHQMVRLVLAEQLYRAFSILEGRPYHH